MAAGIKMTTSDSEAVEYLKSRVQAQRRVMVDIAKQACIEGVNAARRNGSYQDQTGNLRSSVGGAVLNDGEIVFATNFAPVKGGAEGTAKGKAYLQKVAASYPNGVVVIGVAGMNYGRYVFNRGYDVLTSGELKVRRVIQEQTKAITQ